MRKATLLAIIALTLTISLRAQSDPTTDEMLKNGFLGTGTYTGNAEYNVNLYNGNLIVALPLVTLPGRGGHDLRLTMSYNSKQLVREQTQLYGMTYWNARFFQEGPTSGRWLVSSWPTLQYLGSCYYFTSPDGAVHRLDRAEGPYLYASDGSGLRYAPGPRVEFLDGSYFDFSAGDRVYHVDRNGNVITYETPVRGVPAGMKKITDTLGREVLMYYETDPNSSDSRIHQIVVKNHQGADLVWTFGYQTKTILPLLTVYVTGRGWVTYYDFDHNHFHGPYYGATLSDVASGPVSVLGSLTLPNGTSYQFTYNDDVINGCPGYPSVTASTLQLTSMTLPTGAAINVDYTIPPGNPSFESSKIYDGRLAHLVGAVTLDPGGSTHQVTPYAYTYDVYSNVTQTTETRPDGSKRIVNWNPANSGDRFLRNIEYIKDTDGTTTLQRVSTGWTTNSSGKYVGFTETGYYDAGTEVSSSRRDQVYDSWGNVTETRLSDPPSQTEYRAKTTRQFTVYTSAPYISVLTKEENWTGYCVSSSTDYMHDVGYPYYPLTDRGTVIQHLSNYDPWLFRANLTRVRRFLVSENRYVETKYFYDTVGNVVQVTDPLNHSTTTAYSPTYHYAYPTAVTNAKGQTVQTTYNFNTSLVTAVTDGNNQTTSFQYETYNRLSRVDRPNGGWETREYVDNYFTGQLRTYVRTRKSVDSGGAVSEEVNYQDGLGRLLKTKIVEGPTVASYVDREYAACSCTGKTAKVSMPYRQGTPIWTQTQYDGLGRIRKVIPPDGSSASNYTEYRYKVARVTASYGNGCLSENQRTNPTRLFVGVFDAKGIGRVQVYDVDGRLREVREDAAADFSSAYVTEYKPEIDTNYFYKPGDPTPYIRYSLPTIVQGAQNRWQRVDSLGRTTQEQQAESGLTSFTYDDAGRALTKTDSRGIVTTTYYDEINRPTSVTFSDGTPGITYAYDTGSYGIGRLASAGNSVATSAYTYNNVGQVTREDKTINGVPFYTTYGYNLAGQVTTARLPNGTILTNNYDGVGRLASLTSDWVDGNHPATLASGLVYNAAQAVAQVDFGNGTRMTRTFNSGLQLKNLQQGTPGVPGSLLDLEYNYQETVSNNGRIMGITNYNDRTKDLSYTYDDLYRLATAETAGSHWGLSWTYDRYGNRLTQSVTKGTAPASSLAYDNATNRVNGWTYDNAGNTLNDGRHTYTWNALNQQTTMDGTAAEYRYDAQGNRVLKITPTKTTYYVFGSGEYSGGVWEKLYVSLNGQKLVEYSNGTTYFFHSDHLGTPRVQTNISGAVVETWDAYPFGEQWTMTGGVGNKHHYTGKERDPESANDYFGARYYWNGAGRWLSVDPARMPTDPQQLNLYAYVRNDPVNYMDPTGAEAVFAGTLRICVWVATGTWNKFTVTESCVEYDVYNVQGAATHPSYTNGMAAAEAAAQKATQGSRTAAILAHLKKEKDDFVEKKFDETCLNWFKSTFGIDMKEVQDYAKDKMTLVNGATSEAPYAGTTVKDFLKSHPGARFLSPYDHGTDVYYYPDRLFTDASYGADFAHEILHKKNKDWNDEYLLQRVGHQPNELSGWITKEISDHCYPKGGQ